MPPRSGSSAMTQTTSPELSSARRPARSPRIGRRRGVGFAALIAAGVAIDARADISGFGTFAPINFNAAADPSITYNGYYGQNFQVTAQDVGNQAVSGFSTQKQDITAFVAKYTYLATHGGGTPADGLAFLMHNDPRGTSALGGPGGEAGYRGTNAITPSVGMHLGLYFANNGALALATNGTPGGFFYTGDANTHQQYPIDFTFSYFGTTLTTTMRAGNSGRVYTRSDTVNIPSVVGANTAYIGFSGGTGGATATQQVQNFNFKNVSGTFNPIKTLGGFNYDVIVESGATNFQSAVTATIDNGSNRNDVGELSGATFYERGFNAAAPTTGVPTGGTLTTSAADALHKFTMQPANGNNAILLNADNTVGGIALETPAKYKALSFLTTTGNGSGTFDVRLIFADGSPDEVLKNVASPDWFNGGGTAITAAGRVNPNLSFDNVGLTNPRLYQQDYVLQNQASPVAAMEFTYAGGGGNSYIFAISGIGDVVVPEPGSIAVIGLSAIGLLTRRQRRRYADSN